MALAAVMMQRVVDPVADICAVADGGRKQGPDIRSQEFDYFA